MRDEPRAVAPEHVREQHLRVHRHEARLRERRAYGRRHECGLRSAANTRIGRPKWTAVPSSRMPIFVSTRCDATFSGNVTPTMRARRRCAKPYASTAWPFRSRSRGPSTRTAAGTRSRCRRCRAADRVRSRRRTHRRRAGARAAARSPDARPRTRRSARSPAPTPRACGRAVRCRCAHHAIVAVHRVQVVDVVGREWPQHEPRRRQRDAHRASRSATNRRSSRS